MSGGTITTTTAAILLLLGSAATGALVSSVMTLIGQRLERKSRRMELLLAESVRLAVGHRDSLLKIAEFGRQEVFIPEQAKLVHSYYVALSHLLIEGTLPVGMFRDAPQAEQDAFAEKHRYKGM